MCSLIALLMLLLGGIFGFTMAAGSSVSMSPPPALELAVATAEPVVPTEPFACATQSPAQDMADALQFIDQETFDASVWTSEGGFTGDRTTTTWRADSLGAVAYLEYLHFDCGVTEAQIVKYYSPENFEIILSNYSSYQKSAECRQEGVTLFEYDAVFEGADYHMLYWVWQVSPTRVADFMLLFPVTEQAQQAEYAGGVIPRPADLRSGGSMIYQHGGANYSIRLEPLPNGEYRALIGEREIVVKAEAVEGGWLLTLAGRQVRVYTAARGNERYVALEGETYTLSVSEGRRRATGVAGGDLTAQMPGQVREVFVGVGDTVTRGQTLLLLEAMKMEIRVGAPADGRIKRILVQVGEVVDRGQRLVELFEAE